LLCWCCCWSTNQSIKQRWELQSFQSRSLAVCVFVLCFVCANHTIQWGNSGQPPRSKISRERERERERDRYIERRWLNKEGGMCAREEGPHTSSTMTTTMMMWEGRCVRGSEAASEWARHRNSHALLPSLLACLLEGNERCIAGPPQSKITAGKWWTEGMDGQIGRRERERDN